MNPPSLSAARCGLYVCELIRFASFLLYAQAPKPVVEEKPPAPVVEEPKRVRLPSFPVKRSLSRLLSISHTQEVSVSEKSEEEEDIKAENIPMEELENLPAAPVLNEALVSSLCKTEPAVVVFLCTSHFASVVLSH